MKIFNAGFKKFQTIFEFQPDPEYQMMTFDALKEKVNDQMFIDSCNEILKQTSKDDWNKAYGFKGRPALKDWLNVFIPKVIEKRRYKICPITKANLLEIYFDYPDHYLVFLNQQKQGKLEASEEQNKKHSQGMLGRNKSICYEDKLAF